MRCHAAWLKFTGASDKRTISIITQHGATNLFDISKLILGLMKYKNRYAITKIYTEDTINRILVSVQLQYSI